MARPLRPEVRESLLQHAAKAFALEGYDRVGLDRLAADCEVTKGAIYFHFRGKLELFYAAIAGLEVQLEEQTRFPSGAANALEELEHWLRSRLEFHREHPELERLYEILDTELRGEAGSVLRSGLRTRLRNRRTQLRALLQRAAAEGAIELQDDPASEAFHLLAAFQGVLLQHRASPEDAAPFLGVDRFLSSWLRGRAPRRRKRAGLGPRPAARQERGDDFQPPF